MAAKAGGGGGESKAGGGGESKNSQITFEPYKLPHHPNSDISLGPAGIRLVAGEILAFRVEIKFKKDEDLPAYTVMVKHQGIGDTDRRIENATQTPEGNVRNYVIENVFHKIKKYYLASFQTVSSPVFAFSYMVRQIIEENNDAMTKLLRKDGWWKGMKFTANALNFAIANKEEDEEEDEEIKSLKQDKKTLLAQMESQILVPLLEKIRDLVKATDEAMWTHDTLHYYRRWLDDNSQPMNCYVRYYFCEYVMRYYLNYAEKVFREAQEVQNLKKKLHSKVPKKKKKKKQKHISNQSLTQIIGASAAVVMKDRVAEEIKGFTEIIGRVYQTYKKGGPHGTPLSLNIMRSSTGEAKKAAIEASLSLKVVPATAPHFHLCLNSTYLEECIQKNVSPEPLLAIKISHVRRYRAANVRNDQSKMKKNSQLDLKGADADSKANSIYSNNKEKLMGNGFLQSFDEDSIKFIRRQTTDLPGRSKRLQNEHKEIQTQLKEMEAILNMAETSSGQDLPPSEKKVAAEGGGEPAAKGSGESAEEEEMSKDIGQLLSMLGDDEEAQSVKKEYTDLKRKIDKVVERIKASENKLNKLRKENRGRAKIDKATEQLQDKKKILEKRNRDLYALIHKITILSEKKIPIK